LSAVPFQECRGAEQRIADDPVDRAVGDQREQGVGVVIEHAGDGVGQAFVDGIAEQVVEFLIGTAQQPLAGFPVTRRAQDMKPAAQKQDFIVWYLALRSPQQNGDLEQKTLQPLDNPFGPKPVTDVSGTTSPL
jgi:hypothetical protein